MTVPVVLFLIKSLPNTVFCVTVESIWSVNRLAPLRRRYGKGKDYFDR